MYSLELLKLLLLAKSFIYVLQVGTNGFISFGREFNFTNVALFPSTSAGIYFSYVVAPFWSDIDTRLAGKVTYSVHDSNSTILESVNNYIRRRLQDNSNFRGVWALVATWENVRPYLGEGTLSATSTLVRWTRSMRTCSR